MSAGISSSCRVLHINKVVKTYLYNNFLIQTICKVWINFLNFCKYYVKSFFFTSSKEKRTWEAFSQEELKKSIHLVNTQYHQYEQKTSPPDGYIVRFFKENDLATCKPSATKRNLKDPLTPAHQQTCPFCCADGLKKISIGGSDLDTTRKLVPIVLIKSLSSTPLLIPAGDSPPPHWFAMEPEDQLALLESAQKIAQLLKQVEGLQNKPLFLELHCGKGGRQTEWHTHLRIELQEGLWKDYTNWPDHLNLR